MLATFFNTVFYNPIYNALIGFVNIAPWGDVGIAIILLTIFVKVVLLPISIKAAKTQRLMKKIEPRVEEIKKKFKDNAEEQMRQIMAIYKEHGFNPFLNFLLILAQLPVIFALYFVFFKGGLPVVHTDLLYSFIPSPEVIRMQFLGVIDVAGKSFVFALFAGITQFILFYLTFPKPQPLPANPTFKEEFSRNMAIQMRYVFPVIVTGIAWSISTAVALYWTVSNIFSIGQEYFVRRKLDHDEKKQVV